MISPRPRRHLPLPQRSAPLRTSVPPGRKDPNKEVAALRAQMGEWPEFKSSLAISDQGIHTISMRMNPAHLPAPTHQYSQRGTGRILLAPETLDAVVARFRKGPIPENWRPPVLFDKDQRLDPKLVPAAFSDWTGGKDMQEETARGSLRPATVSILSELLGQLLALPNLAALTARYRVSFQSPVADLNTLFRNVSADISRVQLGEILQALENISNAYRENAVLPRHWIRRKATVFKAVRALYNIHLHRSFLRLGPLPMDLPADGENAGMIDGSFFATNLPLEFANRVPDFAKRILTLGGPYEYPLHPNQFRAALRTFHTAIRPRLHSDLRDDPAFLHAYIHNGRFMRLKFIPRAGTSPLVGLLNCEMGSPDGELGGRASAEGRTLIEIVTDLLSRHLGVGMRNVRYLTTQDELDSRTPTELRETLERGRLASTPPTRLQVGP